MPGAERVAAQSPPGEWPSVAVQALEEPEDPQRAPASAEAQREREVAMSRRVPPSRA